MIIITVEIEMVVNFVNLNANLDVFAFPTTLFTVIVILIATILIFLIQRDQITDLEVSFLLALSSPIQISCGSLFSHYSSEYLLNNLGH